MKQRSLRLNPGSSLCVPPRSLRLNPGSSLCIPQRSLRLNPESTAEGSEERRGFSKVVDHAFDAVAQVKHFEVNQ